MTAASLRSHTCKDLGKLARKEGVAGWHSMRKDELIRALILVARKKSRAEKRHAKKTSGSSNGQAKPPTRTPRRVKKFQSTQRLLKLLHSESANGKRVDRPSKDKLVVMVRDPYWLHASWQLRRSSVERAAAALGKDWHTAIPVLRLLAVGRNGTTNTTERVVRDIEIHGGVTNWYVDVTDPPKAYQLDIGYLATNEKFHSICRSNIVETPVPGAGNEIDHNWDDVARNCDKIYAMSGGVDGNGSAQELKELFEERLRRPMGSPMVTRYGIGADSTLKRRDDFSFEVDAEIIVFGSTSPDAHVTFRGEPLELREDGTFTIRMSFPDRRQVIPVVATRSDGVEQRTTVLAVERNTKVMETRIHEPQDSATHS